ncbi:hypothetical protein D8B26_000738 [Coccidioides posadasii str. Silveira]|uniref:Rhodopsin domain-containing protein n=1 Tax=Coccidioides posadasii (strain RMSCC 757 / Silveira) TaxID=443226 RepID=E9CSF1_COCPS|nr:conserved hypothetical protein [Coccidioides posadasii str. Silveira]QVM06025.1 hypothetical protein D8B26_000738 [Coccidioides posadasii str. Silveira]
MDVEQMSTNMANNKTFSGNNTPAQYDIIIEQPKLVSVVLVLICVATLIYLLAIFVRWKHNRLRDLECVFMLSAFVFYLVYEIMLLVSMPLFYRLNAVNLGLIEKYPTALQDKERFILLLFVNNLIFLFLLWSVKFGLLVLYRRLMIGLPRQLKVWLVVLVYTAITFLFSFITTLTACGGISNLQKDLRTFCSSPVDNITRNLNFFGSFASDVSTDLLIMVLPLRLIWGLQMSSRRKLAVGALFSVGIFCTITATIRLVQITSKTRVTNPNALWLALWGSVESTTAIIVGSLPSLRFVRRTSRPTGAGAYTTSNTGWANSRKFHSIQMQPYSPNNTRHVTTVYGGPDTSSSRESLAPKNGVLVTTQHQIRTERIIPG